MDIYSILASKPHSVHHLRRYVKFISHCQQTYSGHSAIEKHHICPKAPDLFPNYTSFKDHPWNCAKLTRRQHFIAHRMLHKVYGGSQSYAFYAMCNMNVSVHKNSKMYSYIIDEFRKLHSKNLTGIGWDEIYGKEKADEYRAAISKKFRERNIAAKGKSRVELYGAERAKEMNKKTGDITKGKTYVEMYGAERATKIIETKSRSLSDYYSGKSKVELYGSQERVDEINSKISNSIVAKLLSKCPTRYVYDTIDDTYKLIDVADLTNPRYINKTTSAVRAKNMITGEILIVPYEYFNSPQKAIELAGQTSKFQVCYIKNRKEYSVDHFVKNMLKTQTYNGTLTS